MKRPDDLIIRHIIHKPGSFRPDQSIVLRVSMQEGTRAHIRDSAELFQTQIADLGRTGETVVMTVAEFEEHNYRAARTPGRRSQVLTPKTDPVNRFPDVHSYVERNSAGYIVAKLTNAPALPAAIDKELWGPRDAAAMMSVLPTFYRSAYGRAQEAHYRHFMCESGFDPEQWAGLLDPDERVLEMARIIEDERTTTILAQEDFAQMLKAAALTAPNTELHRDELISPSGLVFFAREQDLSDLVLCQDPLIRAISWWTVETLDGLSIDITFYVDGPSAWRMSLETEEPDPGAPVTDEDTFIGPEELYRFLYPVERITTTIDQDSQPLPTDEKFTQGLGLIRSIKAVAKSAHTRDELTDTESPKQRKMRRRKGLRQPRQVRVLSLVNPDYGRYEMDAATGRKLRSHWVRGHWRQQWYPSLEDHRTIWIDGFIRGDADLGTVTGRKIYVARGTAA
ncbi:hypothetical protein [Arthrobacter koreensis]|uniref:hypothetical protein n=1 Tax=Arthrobacter koreensis TaxID=199136 RepID=UPI0038079431